MTVPVGVNELRSEICAHRELYLVSFFWFSCSSRSSCQRAYCSTFVGSGSSSPFSQKANQSTLPCWDTIRSHGFCRIWSPSSNITISTALPSLVKAANHSHSLRTLIDDLGDTIRKGIRTLLILKPG